MQSYEFFFNNLGPVEFWGVIESWSRGVRGFWGRGAWMMGIRFCESYDTKFSMRVFVYIWDATPLQRLENKRERGVRIEEQSINVQ